GPAPALLQALTLCYDGLGQTDLAAECRMLGEGFGQNPLMDEHEGGPEMVEERDDSLDPGDEELESGEGPRAMFEIGDEAGSPEEALKELEALLSGAGSSLEGETIEAVVSEDDDPVTVEEPAAVDDVPDEVESGEGDKSELWAQILEQADDVEDTGTPPPAAGTIDLDADLDTVTPAIEDVGAIDLDAPIDLDADLDTVTPAVEDVGAIDLDTPLDLEGVAAFDTDIDPIEGLEVSTPGGEADISMVEGLDDASLETGPEEVDIGGEEDLIPGPLDLSSDTLDAVSEGIELDDPLDLTSTGIEDEAVVTDDEALDEMLDLTAVVADDLDVDDALKSLEAELQTGSVTDDGVGSLLKDDAVPADEAPVNIGLDDEEIPLDLDQVLDDLGESEDIKPVADEKEDSDEPARKEPEVDWVVGSAGSSTQIENNDDSIRVAIEAEILAGKGEYKEAARLYEALQLWEPDRESYRFRLDDLRRMAKRSDSSD
ncbi:hypothetical protein ACFL6R_03940, partial [Gemmatimonadota bacterium]